MEIHCLAAAQRRGGVELLAAQQRGEVEKHGSVERLAARRRSVLSSVASCSVLVFDHAARIANGRETV